MSEAVTVISFLTYPGIFSWRECERLEEISGKPIPPRISEHESEVLLLFHSASCFVVACLGYSSILKMEEICYSDI
jgi:hypothetical protein